MKRQKLIDRAALLHNLQNELADAARDFTNKERDSTGSRVYVEQARRGLLTASIRYGIACQRYLGGRGE